MSEKQHEAHSNLMEIMSLRSEHATVALVSSYFKIAIIKSKMNAFIIALWLLLGGRAKAQVAASVDRQPVANRGFDVSAYFEDSKAGKTGISIYRHLHWRKILFCHRRASRSL